jgi:hypothetical protein
MMALRLGQHAFGIVAALGMLAGCGPALTSPGVTTGTFDAGGRPARAALLYVAHSETLGVHRHVGVAVLTFPQGKPVASISGHGAPSGVCADASGNVWIPFLRASIWYVDEFARGGTNVIAQLRMPNGSFAGGCSVDPVSGDLAVANRMPSSASVDIWPGARKGKPTIYSAPFVPLNAAYDGASDLFIDGWDGGSIFYLRFGELAKGSGSIAKIPLDKRVFEPGGIQWDGAYAAVETGEGYHRSRIYRVQVSGSRGHVIGAVYPEGLVPMAPFAIHGADGGHIAVWPYPAGGEPTRMLRPFKYITGVAISK